MGREIKLDGGEISVLKAIGTSGAQIYGKLLIDRIGDLEKGEFLETLTGLLSLGYVVSNKVNVRLFADVEKAFFRISPAHAKDLRSAMHPGKRRDEERSKRQRRG